MTQYILLPRGSTATENARIAPEGVTTVDTEAKTVRLHDGFTPGGHTIHPTDQLTGYTKSLFLTYEVWAGGAGLSDLGLKVTVLGAGTFTFPDMGDLTVGVQIYLATGASAATIEVYESDDEYFIWGGSLVQSLILPARSLTLLAKSDTDRTLIMSQQIFPA